MISFMVFRELYSFAFKLVLLKCTSCFLFNLGIFLTYYRLDNLLDDDTFICTA